MQAAIAADISKKHLAICKVLPYACQIIKHQFSVIHVHFILTATILSNSRTKSIQNVMMIMSMRLLLGIILFSTFRFCAVWRKELSLSITFSTFGQKIGADTLDIAFLYFPYGWRKNFTFSFSQGNFCYSNKKEKQVNYSRASSTEIKYCLPVDL